MQQLHHICFSQFGSIHDTNSQDEFTNETKIIIITFFEYNQSYILSSFVLFGLNVCQKKIEMCKAYGRRTKSDKNTWHGPLLGIMVMMLNDTFNNISVISWWSVLLGEETGETTDLPQVTCKLYHIMLVTFRNRF